MLIVDSVTNKILELKLGKSKYARVYRRVDEI
jgi:hypothetical protein